MARNIMSVFNQRPRDNELFDAPMESVPMSAEISTHPAAQMEAQRPLVKLGKTLVFKGELFIGEDALLLGRVEGTLTHEASLTVGVGGMVIGDVTGRTIIIKGTVEGDIEASDSVVIIPGAVVIGDIIAPRVNIIEGAQFNGSIKMINQPPPVVEQKPPVTLDGSLSEEAVDQLLQLLADRKKAS